MKNELEKPNFDKKRMGHLYDEMHSSLGDRNTCGHGMFRKRFIQVCALPSSFILQRSDITVQHVQLQKFHFFSVIQMMSLQLLFLMFLSTLVFFFLCLTLIISACANILKLHHLHARGK